MTIIGEEIWLFDPRFADVRVFLQVPAFIIYDVQLESRLN